MKAGKVVIGAVFIALLAVGSGFYGGAKYAASSLRDGFEYVYGCKPLPLETENNHNLNSPVIRYTPRQHALIVAKSFCSVIVNAGESTSEECRPFLEEPDR